MSEVDQNPNASQSLDELPDSSYPFVAEVHTDRALLSLVYDISEGEQNPNVSQTIDELPETSYSFVTEDILTTDEARRDISSIENCDSRQISANYHQVAPEHSYEALQLGTCLATERRHLYTNIGLDILKSSDNLTGLYVTTSTLSPVSTLTSPSHTSLTYTTLQNVTMLKPCIEIIEQPVSKFRFRYKSEMKGAHGSLGSMNSSKGRAGCAPTVELKNFLEAAVVRCTLVTTDPQRRGPHPHRLVRKVEKQFVDDPHEINVSPELGMVASFDGMGIIHTARLHAGVELVKKKRAMALEEARRTNVNENKLSVRQETTIKMEAEVAQKLMDLNSVALCFQAYLPDTNGVLTPLTDPVYSTPINNLKSALTGELKICRIDKVSGSCDGNEEVFMLVEKVGKSNIKIRFFELDQNDQEIWSGYGRFEEPNVHHQYAIVFQTPPYRDKDISEPRQVFVRLERTSDGDCSESVKFTYKPSGRMIRGRKRARMSLESTDHLTPTTNSMGAPEQPAGLTSHPNREDNLIGSDLDKHIDQPIPDSAFENLYEFFESLIRPEGAVLDGPSKKKETLSFTKTIYKETEPILISRDSKMDESISALFNKRTVNGDFLLHFALRHNQLDFVKYILSVIASSPQIYEPIVNRQTRSGRTCLHYAVEQNQPDITKALLDLGADANACDDHGFSPLHVAVKFPEAGQCVETLLKGGKTNIEARDDAGWTALHLAAEAGSLKAIEALVKAKVNVNSTDMSYGRTALHIAVEGGHKEIVKFLLTQTKIDVNKRNFSGNTALHSAVVNTGVRAIELCTLLIHHGANPSIANNNRNSAKESLPEAVEDQMEYDDEVESDQETTGETSFDLASGKLEILQLFAEMSLPETSTSPSVVITDRKVVGVVDHSEEEIDRSFLDKEAMSLLVPILDASKSWEKLAKSLRYNLHDHIFYFAFALSVIILSFVILYV